MSSLSLRRLLFAGALLAAPFVSHADPKPPPQLDEGTSEALKSLQALVDAADTASRAGNLEEGRQKWQACIDLLENLKPKTKDGSYDRFIVEDTLGKIYWQGKNDPAAAVQHFLVVREMVEQHEEYQPEKDRLEHIKWLAQAWYQRAIAIKNNPAALAEGYDQAMRYMKEYLERTKKPQQDDMMLYAMLLYNKATTDHEHVNKPVLAEAEQATRNAIMLVSKPRPDLYQLLIAILENKGDMRSAAEYLELLLKQKPTDKEMWGQLFALYSNLAGTAEKDRQLQRDYFARAINTIEKAQRLGYLKSPRDNYNLVTLYSQVDQTGTAVRLLDEGLHRGTIESKPDNWFFLSSFYQQLEKPNEAISVLKDAVKLYPENGDFYFNLYQGYSAVYNTEAAYRWAKAATEHPHFHQVKAWSVWYALAYSAYELQKYDEAMTAIDATLNQTEPPMPANQRKGAESFREAIRSQLKLRETQKQAANL